MKTLGLFTCHGLYDWNKPCCIIWEHIGPANTVQNTVIIAGINPPQFNPQHPFPIHAENN